MQGPPRGSTVTWLEGCASNVDMSPAYAYRTTSKTTQFQMFDKEKSKKCQNIFTSPLDPLLPKSIGSMQNAYHTCRADSKASNGLRPVSPLKSFAFPRPEVKTLAGAKPTKDHIRTHTHTHIHTHTHQHTKCHRQLLLPAPGRPSSPALSGS